METIDKLVNERNSNNDDENFVLDIYYKFKDDCKDEFEQRGIKCNKEKELVL